MKSPSVVDLFCGCGGMSWGLQKAGFHILAGVDNWQPALKTFQHNHVNAATIFADLSVLSPAQLAKQLSLAAGDLDCIIGGPPCQGFSKNVPATYRFLKDPRNQLFRRYLEFVAYLRPKIVIMENVAEIYKAYNGTVRNEISELLTNLGYRVNIQVILASDYGVPQNRRRCLFLASRTDIPLLTFPEPTFASLPIHDLFRTLKQHRSAWSAISDLPILENGEGFDPMPYSLPPENDFQMDMRKDSTIIFDHVTRRLNEKQLSRVMSLQAGQGLKDLPDNLRPKSGYSGAYGRLDYEGPAPTITRWVFHPGSGRYCHPQNARLITIREAARLQSFSDDFQFTGTYIQKAHQIGNAVPPVLMQVVGSNVKFCLGIPEAPE